MKRVFLPWKVLLCVPLWVFSFDREGVVRQDGDGFFFVECPLSQVALLEASSR